MALPALRVLYIEAPVGFGGSLTGLLQLIAELPAHVEPVLVTSFDPAPFIDLPAGLTHRQADVPTWKAAGGHWIPGVARYLRQHVGPWTRAVDQYLREFRPHLIHANNSVTVNWPAARAARRWGIPAIAHQKGFEYPGRLSRWLVTHGGFTHHIATSGAIAQQLYSLGLPPQRCTTIYEPVSGPADDAWDRPRDNPIPVVGMHSVLGHWKGQHVVLQALAEVIRRNRTPVALEIAGAPPAGETDYLDSLHRLVADLGIEKHVRFVGHLRDVYAFLSRVDFAVHASVDPEPFGRVVAEAMLCGLPVIVTTQGGPAEYIEDGVSGCHVPCGDVRATADAIERLAASADLRRRMGRAARQFAVREFEPRRLTEQVVDVYDRVLDRPRALEAGPSDMNPGSYDRLRATR